ncbi:MAG: carbohydrate ABC transporter permease [Roseburia sp.]|nr:carbohydrate ABC transporter permease [Roseburia sp.]MCM1279069.1 carbohydrate ABC transporter permease [Robinsoniella sp.]
MNRNKKKHNFIQRAVLFIIVALFATSFAMPILLTITNSFMKEEEVLIHYGNVYGSTSEETGYVSKEVDLKLIPDIVSIRQYETVLLLSPEYLLKFWNSVILTVPIVIFQIAVSLAAAYGFTRVRSKRKEVLFFVYTLLMMMPFQVSLVPNYLVAGKLGILNTYWAIILPGIFSTFSTYLLTKFMRRIPVSLIEAARLDGAGEWSVFTKICIPLCKSAIVSVAILLFIDYWNMVEQPLIMLPEEEAYPLSVYLSTINTGEITLAFAVSVIYMVPAIFVILYGEDYLIDGISCYGGVK